MVTSVFVFTVLVIVISSILFSILAIRGLEYKKRRIIVSAIILSFIFILLKSFFIPEYPDPNSLYKVEGEIVRQYNPDESYLVADVNKWVNIDNFGWMYVSRIESVDGQQFRMFCRLIGPQSDDIYNLNTILSDDHNNICEANGGGMHNALLLSACALDFLLEDDSIKVGDEFRLIIAGKDYVLN